FHGRAKSGDNYFKGRSAELKGFSKVPAQNITNIDPELNDDRLVEMETRCQRVHLFLSSV
ncbi:hypothetical protein SB775_33590, partial [Peribacillus sp. SIMBA_075]|uniref:hypothetical protein n=1 Tax=Peribacillus sp. SIMBA_075 TaxID=3085813 RepID=UPI003979D0B8